MVFLIGPAAHREQPQQQQRQRDRGDGEGDRPVVEHAPGQERMTPAPEHGAAALRRKLRSRAAARIERAEQLLDAPELGLFVRSADIGGRRVSVSSHVRSFPRSGARNPASFRIALCRVTPTLLVLMPVMSAISR